ncbi:MAG: SAM-dependent methyltransferase, partial [Pseudomonadota bacterium]
MTASEHTPTPALLRTPRRSNRENVTDTPPPDDEAAGSRPAHAGWVVDHIRTHGPLTVAAFMAKALTDRDHGYYRHRPAIGTEARGGDFTTAPEISQVFGELIGVWLALAWQQFGAPDRLRIVELGPGRGTLIRDARRAFRQVVRTLGEPVPTLDLVLVEINPTLREIQAATLGTGSQEAMAGHAPRWVADVRQVAGDPSHTGSVDRSGAWPCVLVANEFIDALPVSQLVRTERSPTGWAERTVALDGEERLCFDKGAPAANPVGGAQGGQGTPNATAAAAIGAIAESRAETLRALALATTIAGWAAQAP